MQFREMTGTVTDTDSDNEEGNPIINPEDGTEGFWRPGDKSFRITPVHVIFRIIRGVGMWYSFMADMGMSRK